MTRLAVIIPTIGRATLFQAVESIHEPSLQIQIVVVVDRPAEFEKIQKSLEGYSCKVIKGSGLGASYSRWIGIQQTESEYVAFLDDDDYWEPRKAETQINLIENAALPERTFAVTNCYFERSSGKLMKSGFSSNQINTETFGHFIVARRHALYRGNPFCNSTLLFPRSLLAFADLSNDNVVGHDDWAFFIELWKRRDIACVLVEEHLATLRQGSKESLSANMDPSSSIEFFKRHHKDIPRRSASDFLLVNLLLPLVLSSKYRQAFAISKKFGIPFPHFSAIARFVIGFLKRR